MAQVLCHLPKIEDENLLVGLDTSDDAAVYRISDELALIQTLDFFTPMIDDPYMFGQIAAANALSDIYAMGGEPKLAMNIVCFPDCLSPDILTEILKGGQDKVKEANALLVGGHSVSDDEPKYGLSVTGFVDPNKVYTNSNALTGDILVLTKPLGSGILSNAIKGEIATDEEYQHCVRVMATLNKFGKEAMENIEGIHSVTDITGFGLLGHCLEIGENSGKTLVIDHKKLPLMLGALDYAKMGLVPKGAYNNRLYMEEKIHFEEGVNKEYEDILYDPQTSGGLLISIAKDNLEELLLALEDSPVEYGVIGYVEDKLESKIIVR